MRHEVTRLNLGLQSNVSLYNCVFRLVFRLVFGDGDSNSRILHSQWKTLSAVIDASNGAVVAEQLRPFLLNPQSHENESDFLPVLTHFNGTPKVSKDGDLIYVFDELESTAYLSRAKNVLTDASLCEKPLKFSHFVWMFAMVNLIGVLLMY